MDCTCAYHTCKVLIKPQKQNCALCCASHSGTTPVIWSAFWGHAECVRLLLDRGADPELACKDGMNAIGWAASVGQKTVLELLNAKTRGSPRGDPIQGPAHPHQWVQADSTGVQLLEARLRAAALVRFKFM